jgi:hypothetical protein
MLSETLSKSPHPELITKLQKTFPESTSITEIPYFHFNQLLSAYTELQPTLNEIASYYDNETPIPTLNDSSSSLIKINPLHICNTQTDEEQYIDCYLNSQGEITGLGTILTQNGNFYKGEFQHNVFHGLGFFINGGDATINPHFDLCSKEITLVGSWVYTLRDYATTFDFLKRAQAIGLPIKELITHKFGLNEMNEALETNLAQKGLKIAYINKDF